MSTQTDDLTGGVLLVTLGWAIWTLVMFTDTILGHTVLMFRNLSGHEVIAVILLPWNPGFIMSTLMILIEPTGIYEATPSFIFLLVLASITMVSMVSVLVIYSFGTPLPKWAYPEYHVKRRKARHPQPDSIT